MLMTSLRNALPLLLLLPFVLVACHRATTAGRCDMALNAAPSVSVVHFGDSTRTGLPVAVLSSFPEHKPLGGATVSLYTDTLDVRATTPLRQGTTDANGHLQLEALPAGRYGLRAQLGTSSFFSPVTIRGRPDSLEVRLVTQSQICY
jgi:hypothetical protein